MRKRQKRGAHTSQDKAIVLSLVRSIFDAGCVSTTARRVVLIRPIIDRIIIKAKKHEKVHDAIRAVFPVVKSLKTARAVIKYARNNAVNRRSGFTSAVKKGYRRGDGALMTEVTLIDWKEKEKKTNKSNAEKDSKNKDKDIEKADKNKK